jgi:hypothetical protein
LNLRNQVEYSKPVPADSHFRPDPKNHYKYQRPDPRYQFQANNNKKQGQGAPNNNNFSNRNNKRVINNNTNSDQNPPFEEFNKFSTNNHNLNFNSNFNSFNFQPHFTRVKIAPEDLTFYKDNQDLLEALCKQFEYLKTEDYIELLKVFQMRKGATVFEIMNEFVRENIIKRNLIQNSGQGVKKFNEKINIFEADEREITPMHQFIVKQYKTEEYKQNPNIPDDPIKKAQKYHDYTDRRRKIFREINGFYNYLPVLCQQHKANSISNDPKIDDCIYAHSENEIVYHSLTYKTSLCTKTDCDNNLCSNAHNLSDDFRKIFEMDDKKAELMTLIEKSEFLRFSIKPYLFYMKLPTQFSLEDYKIHPCKLSGLCQTDPHMCMFYHDVKKEKRRPFKLFNLENEFCPNAKPGRDSEFYPHLCPRGDYCTKIHTRYEMLYHPQNFRKIQICTREKVNHRCKFWKTCYGIHPEDRVVDINEKNNYNESNIFEGMVPLEEHEQVLEECENLKVEYSRFKERFKCKSCKKIPEPLIFVITFQCSHLVCENCIMKGLKEKEGLCVVCDKKVKKGELLRVRFEDLQMA